MKSYLKYKESEIEWLGEIPEHWNINSCGRSYEIRLGKMLSPNQISEDEIQVPYLRAVNVQWEKVNIDELPTMWASKNEIDKFTVESGDLLVCEGGEVGRSSILKNLEQPAIIQNALHRVRPAKGNSILYLMYLLENISVTGWFEILCSKATIAHFTGEKFSALRIPNPPSSEQQDIASFLDQKTSKIDKLVSIKEKQIELLKEERTGIINQAVTKGLNPTVKMKDSGNEWQGDVPEHWKISRIKYLIDLNPSKSFAKNDTSSGLVTFLPMEKVNVDGTYDISEQKTIEDVIQGFTYFIEGDILLAKITPCFENGKGAYISSLPTKYGFGSTEFYVLRPNAERINPKYLYYFTKSHFFRVTGEAFMTGAAGQKRVPSEFIQYFILAITGTSEQQAIAEYLDSQTAKIDKSISDARKQIELLKKYRTALISEAVTGKIDVRKRPAV